MTGNHELRECPKCGGTNLRIRTGATWMARLNASHSARIECRDCPDPDWPGAMHETRESAEAAAAVEWNRRPAIKGTS